MGRIFEEGDEMKGTNDTNGAISGTGTASDPYTYNFHEDGTSQGAPWIFWSLVMMVFCGVAIVGFLLGLYFRNKRKRSKTGD